PEGISRHEQVVANSCEVKTTGLVVVDGPLAGRAPPARLDRGPAGVVPRRFARLTMACAPVREQAQRAGELVAGGRQLVHEPLWPLAVRLRQHQALALEAAEALGEHVRRDARQVLLEVAEAPRAVEERLHEKQRPAVAHAVES